MSELDERLEEIIEQKSWAAVGESGSRPDGAYALVDHGGEKLGVLWVYPSRARAVRARVAHSAEYASQLFAVPPAVESGEDWCLVESQDGIAFSDFLTSKGVDSLAELGRESRILLAKGAGTLARKLHEIEVESAYGDLLDEDYADLRGFAGRWLTFNGYCAARLEHFAEEIRQLDFDEESRSTLLKSIGDLRNELSAYHPRHPPALTHGDFTWANMRVSEDGKEIVGLMNFSHARLLPPEADLARLLWLDGLAASEGEVRAFYDGYGAARTMDLQRRERFYRRLAAFEALLDETGATELPDSELVRLTMP
ncbi:MAG: phosphotransferase family protein [Myxococcota bacterium]